MAMQQKLLFLLVVLMILLTACTTNNQKDTKENDSSSEETTELLISAAASLTDAMEEIQEMYEAENNVTLTFNFGGSGKLAQQIQQGAPVDLFISANQNWLQILIDEKLIDAATKVDVTGNKLVLIAHDTSDLAYRSFPEIDLKDLTNVAVGKPESVPAGEYTKESLKSINQWEELESHIVYAQDVRQVLTYVETGNAEIGFVYESDALSSEQVKVLAKADESMHDPIVYPAGVMIDSNYEEEAQQFLDFMTSEVAQEILATYGFTK